MKALQILKDILEDTKYTIKQLKKDGFDTKKTKVGLHSIKQLKEAITEIEQMKDKK